MKSDNVVFTEDEVKLTGITLPWRDVATLMFKIIVLALPVGFCATMVYMMCMAAFGALMSMLG